MKKVPAQKYEYLDAYYLLFIKYDVVAFLLPLSNVCDRKLNKNASSAKNDTKE